MQMTKSSYKQTTIGDRPNKTLQVTSASPVQTFKLEGRGVV